MKKYTQAPIGVFDSGIGGLTVLQALASALPQEDFIYLGDTARLPYGTKSAASVVRYAQQTTRFLHNRGVKLLVIACNTATAAALESLQHTYVGLPVIGVVQPGAKAACAASRAGRIGIIGTERTIAGGSYEREILRLRPDAQTFSMACPLFVALAEEGWCSGAIAEAIAHKYLDALVTKNGIDTLVLGCTHFPVLTTAISAVTGEQVCLVDSARTTALVVKETLHQQNLCTQRERLGQLTFLATDGAERFARVGGVFLQRILHPEDVEIVDL